MDVVFLGATFGWLTLSESGAIGMKEEEGEVSCFHDDDLAFLLSPKKVVLDG